MTRTFILHLEARVAGRLPRLHKRPNLHFWPISVEIEHRETELQREFVRCMIQARVQTVSSHDCHSRITTQHFVS